MQLDADVCYRAMESRDRRFEGRFFIGVKTTGIYCRPGCPARIPKRTNVVFFPCAAAAEQTGLRPCRRCRPDAAPTSPAAIGTPVTVARALRLIDEGALADGGLEGLADRLGVGARHLRRLFAEHVGASPIAIASSARLHFAKKLLEETTLPMSEIAFASGFASIRRFNDAVRKAFDRSPSLLRGARAARAREDARAIELSIAVREPFDWEALLAFLGARAIPSVEIVDGATYARTFRIGEAHGTIRARRTLTGLALEVRAEGKPDLFEIAMRARRLFDTDADPLAITDHLAKDPRLARRVRARPGLRVPGAWDGFELAVRAILGQQVTVRGATTLAGRLVASLGDPIATADARLTHVFPSAARVRELSAKDVGVPEARARSIARVADEVARGRLVIGASSSADELARALVATPGIGPWTAGYVAMRAAREPDAFPSGDLVLCKRASTDGTKVTPKQLEAIAEAWRPFRAYAAMHLWMGGES